MVLLFLQVRGCHLWLQGLASYHILTKWETYAIYLHKTLWSISPKGTLVYYTSVYSFIECWPLTLSILNHRPSDLRHKVSALKFHGVIGPTHSIVGMVSGSNSTKILNLEGSSASFLSWKLHTSQVELNPGWMRRTQFKSFLNLQLYTCDLDV